MPSPVEVDVLPRQKKEVTCNNNNMTESKPIWDNSRSPPPITEETLPQHPHTLHTFFYACEYNTNKLPLANLLTGEQSFHQIPGYQFKLSCRWSEKPGGRLWLYGPNYADLREWITMVSTGW
jgi:hypothetical protein